LGNARVGAIALIAALALAARYAWHLYSTGSRDPGFIFFMTLAAVVAIALVAPRFFTRPPEKRDTWKPDEDDSEIRIETPMPADVKPATRANPNENTDAAG